MPSVFVDSASASLAKGDVVCLVSDAAGMTVVTKATPAALAVAGLGYGVADTAGAAGARIHVLTSGLVPSSITGLSASNSGPVRISNGRCQKVSAYQSGDYPIGFVDNRGYMVIVPSVAAGISGTSSDTKIMLMGDSITLGSTIAGFRQDLYRILRSRRSNFRFIGTQQDGHPGFFVLGDWHHEGHSGFRIEQLDVSSYFASAGIPDVLMLMIGTNNVSNGQAGSTCLSFLGTLLDTIKSLAPNCKVFVSSIPPWVAPAASFAAKEIEREAYNAGISALCSARGVNFSYIDGTAGVGGAHMGNDGIHPAKAGYEIIARNYADALERNLPPALGLRDPRDGSLRPKTPSFSFTAIGNKIVIPYSAGLKPSQTGSFSVGFWFRPSSLPNGFQRLVQYGSTFTSGYLISINTAGGIAEASAYVRSSGAVTFFTTTPGGVYLVNKWHRVWLALDTVANEIRLFITREGFSGHFAWVATNPSLPNQITATDPTTMGNIEGSDACLGAYDGLTVCNSYAVTLADVEADYFEGALPPNVTAYYSLSEGSGTSVADATGLAGPAGTTTGGAWVAAGTNPKPFDE